MGLGQGILETLKALYLFLERELVEQLPLLVANLLSIFPADLYSDILHLLCDALLPFCLTEPATGPRYPLPSLPSPPGDGEGSGTGPGGRRATRTTASPPSS